MEWAGRCTHTCTHTSDELIRQKDGAGKLSVINSFPLPEVISIFCTNFSVFALYQAVLTNQRICISTLKRQLDVINVHMRQKSNGFYDAAFMMPVSRKWGYMCLGACPAPAAAVNMKGA